MSASVWSDESDLSSVADSALSIAARFWYLAAVAGQWIFVAYVVAFHRGTANSAVAIHLFLAVIVITGGPLQLIPQIRRYAPSFHHWNGRLYILAVFVVSIAGLYMIWSRERFDVVRHLGASLHAVLIMSFAVFAVRYAVARDISTHRRWALRLFMVVNAGWFFRVGVMRWIFLDKDPVGFLNFFSLADYLLPLAILEIYLRTKDRAAASGRFALAAGLFVLTFAMSIGIFGATLHMWHLRF